MSDTIDYSLTPIGFIQSSLKRRREAPMQGNEGAPDAWLEMVPTVVMGLRGIAVGQDVILITWLHQARRNILKVHSRSDKNLLLTGVFATRSPDRPNPLGLHRVSVLEIVGNRTSCPNDSSRMPQTKYDKGTIDNIPSQEGKLAVVTGANSGIGWNTALELARAGSEVILTARTEVKGRDAVARIRRELSAARYCSSY